MYLRPWNELTEAHKLTATDYFDSQISPALTPLIIDSAEHFPFLSHLSTSLVFPLEDAESGQRFNARVKVPTGLKQWVPVASGRDSDEMTFVRLHEIIQANLGELYPGMTIGPVSLVRLTRDAEVSEDDSELASVLEQVREQVTKRRFQPVVRLEFNDHSDPAIRELLRHHFQLQATDVFELPGELDYTTLFELMGLSIPGSKDPFWTPMTPVALAGHHNDIFGSFARATWWYTIPMKALMRASNILSKRRPTIRWWWPSR